MLILLARHVNEKRFEEGDVISPVMFPLGVLGLLFRLSCIHLVGNHRSQGHGRVYNHPIY